MPQRQCLAGGEVRRAVSNAVRSLNPGLPASLRDPLPAQLPPAIIGSSPPGPRSRLLDSRVSAGLWNQGSGRPSPLRAREYAAPPSQAPAFGPSPGSGIPAPQIQAPEFRIRVLEAGPEPGAAVARRFLKDVAPNPARGERGGGRGAERTAGTGPGGLHGAGADPPTPYPHPRPQSRSHQGPAGGGFASCLRPAPPRRGSRALVSPAGLAPERPAACLAGAAGAGGSPASRGGGRGEPGPPAPQRRGAGAWQLRSPPRPSSAKI